MKISHLCVVFAFTRFLHWYFFVQITQETVLFRFSEAWHFFVFVLTSYLFPFFYFLNVTQKTLKSNFQLFYAFGSLVKQYVMKMAWGRISEGVLMIMTISSEEMWSFPAVIIHRRAVKETCSCRCTCNTMWCHLFLFSQNPVYLR